MDVVKDLDIRTATVRGDSGAGLGAHRDTYVAVRPPTRRHALEVMGLMLCGTVAAIGAATGAAVLVIPGLAGALMLGVRLVCELTRSAYVHGRDRDTRLELYDGGCVAVVGGRARTIRYDSATVRRTVTEDADHHAPDRTARPYTVTDTGGDPIVLRHTIDRCEEWGTEIDRAVTAAQLPRALATLESGGRLDFAPFWMTSTEIGVEHRSVSWARVSGIVLHKGWISVRIRGESLPLESLPADLIGNFTLFRTVAERMRSATATRA
ncbi:DUF6585 family protein [Nocardia otitidiscaviarum]|uniref:DUF6585 family protein n=1 Tax=Nocardia otitidiscaviarum TaxID=1823 RepID=UPI0018963D26|nr:DUF6585 family protein [Nocardia otitidiscaviarum]MBF6236819.1 hypothetical protein [Nocardia otitidiscaviarum]